MTFYIVLPTVLQVTYSICLIWFIVQCGTLRDCTGFCISYTSTVCDGPLCMTAPLAELSEGIQLSCAEVIHLQLYSSNLALWDMY